MSSRSLAWALLALASLLCGGMLAAGHPVAPMLCLACVWVVSVMCTSALGSLWLLLVPASLPLLNFSPWTGWLVFDEFDMLLLAAFAGRFARLAIIANAPGQRSPPMPPRFWPTDASAWLLAAMIPLAALGISRGFAAAGGWHFDLFQSYTDPMNTLRVGKSQLYALLAWPLLAHELATDPKRAGERLVRGMLAGLVVVTAAALWERLAYPGLFDIASVYRVTALFWEMHVGGGAIDAYLVMAAPFAVLGIVRATHPVTRLALVALLVLLVYVCIMTFSRGVYVALAGMVLLSLAVAGWRRLSARLPSAAATEAADAGARAHPVRWLASLGLVAALVVMWVPGSYMMNRLDKTSNDLDRRLRHWQQAASLLASAQEGLFGIGWGRFPEAFTRKFPGSGLAGTAHVQRMPAPGPSFVRMTGPQGVEEKAGTFALTQRIALEPRMRYTLSGDFRALADTAIVIKVCERHLLYGGQCQGRLLQVKGDPGGWQRHTVGLRGPGFDSREGLLRRAGVFSISVINGEGNVDITGLRLAAGTTGGQLLNGDFDEGMTRWFPSSQYYFVPWHADGLFLELLVERGLVGLLVVLGLISLALARLVRASGVDPGLRHCLAVSLAGVAMIGLISSVIDAPRVAFLLYLLGIFSVMAGTRQGAAPPLAAPRGMEDLHRV